MFEFLILTLIFVCLHYFFSKRLTNPKPKHLDPPRPIEEERGAPIHLISQDLCFLSFTFVFFFLNSILHQLGNRAPIPEETATISKYILWFLIGFAVLYTMVLHTNKLIYCLKWEISKKGRSKNRNKKYIFLIVCASIMSLATITSTFLFSLSSIMKYIE